MPKLDNAARALAPGPIYQPDTTIRCGYCASGQHQYCPRAVRGHGPVATAKIWPCNCGAPQCMAQVLRCIECKNDRPDEVNPLLWACYDRVACEETIRRKLAENPLLRRNPMPTTKTAPAKRRRLKSVPAAEVPAAEVPAAEVPAAPVKRRRKATKSAAPAAAPAAATPKVAATSEPTINDTCICGCGEASNGLFLRGHAIRYVSERVEEVLSKTVKVPDQRARLKADGVSETLIAQFERRLKVARERAQEAREAAKNGTTPPRRTRKAATAKPAPEVKPEPAPEPEPAAVARPKRRRKVAKPAAAAPAAATPEPAPAAPAPTKRRKVKRRRVDPVAAAEAAALAAAEDDGF